MMKSKILTRQKLFFGLLLAAVLGFFLFLNIKKVSEPATNGIIKEQVKEPNIFFEDIPTTTPSEAELIELKLKEIETPKATTTEEKIYIVGVPFVVQAPFGEWKDPRQQDACEEMTTLLAVSWAQGISAITKTEAKEKILSMVEFQEENFSESRDTSTADTIERLYFGLFNYQKVRLEENITSEDIIQELEKGNLVVVPANGQLLKNIHFTQPGPERHMIIIRGFDFLKKEFITNDVGIGVGENYRYPEEVLFNAIADYPSGYHVPRVGTPKVMIVVEKE
jgi:hypothetical protein